MHTRALPPAYIPRPPADERPLAHGLHCPAQRKGYLFAAYEAAGNRRPILIGRGRTCDLRFDCIYLSKVHAIIKGCTDLGYMLQDNDSENGVFVDGVRVTRQVLLRVGMRIRMGRVELIATSERGSFPIEASTVTSFARKAGKLYGSCNAASRHIGRSREFVRLRLYAKDHQ